MAITLFQALLLACTASASILTPRAVCDAKNGLACPSEGIMGCEKNGGHSMRCVKNGAGGLNWSYGDNCPSKKAHCDCNTGTCVPN